MRSDGDRQDTVRGLGLAASVPRPVVEAAARATEGAGFSTLWLNNPPGANAISALSAAAALVGEVRLGVGIVPLSHRSPEQIAADLDRHPIPPERFYLGLGSGSGGGGVERVHQGVQALRRLLAHPLVVAALGPRMCRLGGAEADGVLLNWLTPEYAARSVEWIRRSAQRAGRPIPRVTAYVRVALGADAAARLEEEAHRYESFPHYAAHFERMGARAIDTSIHVQSPDALQSALAAWDGVVDEVVLRVVTASDAEEEIMTLIQAGAPPSGSGEHS